jgi:hypothetical protein
MVDIQVDSKSGAPLNVRAIVSSFNKKEDKLKALKQYFPDAESTDNTVLGDGNFVYTDPDTKLMTLYNETDGGLFDMGVTAGDVVEFGREIVQTAGGVIGGTVATVAGQAGPQVFTPEEMITVPAGAALGSELASKGYDIAMDAMIPKTISRGDVAERIVGSAENVMGEMVGGKLFQNFMGTVSKNGGNLIRKVLGSGAEKREVGKKMVLDAQELGVKVPTAGIASGSPLLQFIEKRIEQFPTAKNQFAENFDIFKRSLVEATDNISKKYSKDSGISGQQIGGKVRTGIEKAKEKFKADQNILYDKAFDLVPEGSSGRLNNVIQLRAELQKKIDANPKAFAEYLNPTIKRIDALLENDGVMDLRIGRELRTALRLTTDATGPGGLVGVTKPQNQYLITLYDALTKDLSQIATDKGSAEAQKAMKVADAYTANRMKLDVTPVINKILKMDTDKKAFDFLVSGTKESGEQLNRVLRNLPEEERKYVRASMLNRLGYRKPGSLDGDSAEEMLDNFSPNSFLTNFSNLSKTSKDALFGKKGNQYRKDLDTIIDLMKNFQSADQYTNFSRTGDAISNILAFAPLYPGGQMMLGGDIGMGALTMGSGLVTPYMASKAVTNPDFIRWIVDASPKMAKNPADVNFHLGRLMEIFSGDDSMTEVALSYVNSLVPTIIGSAEASSMSEGILQEPQTPSEIVQFAKSLKPDVKEKIKSLVPTSDANEVLNNILQERNVQ